MGFKVGSDKRSPEMNVTPLVDVVLVLLIIFMVVTPMMLREFWTQLPKQEKKEVKQPSNNQETLVLQIIRGDKILVNKKEISLDELSGRLKRMFAAKNDHVLFVDIKDDANYGFAVQAMDRAREGGAVTISLLAKKLDQK